MVNQRPIKLGAQDCHYAESGSFTGDVSAKMLKDVGCKYVIIGHSERRSLHAEGDEIIAKKLLTAAKAELTPILCVGESQEIRASNAHLQFVEKQVLNVLSQFSQNRIFFISLIFPSISSDIEMCFLVRICLLKSFEYAV